MAACPITCVSLPYALPSNKTLYCRMNRDAVTPNSVLLNFFSPSLKLSFNQSQDRYNKMAPFVVQAAWTRRSKSEAAQNPRKKSWKQRTDKYMRPFQLDVYISKKYIHAKVMHRVTSKCVAVATTNARDLRHILPSRVDFDACRTVGKLIAERAKEADVYAVAYLPRKGERIEGKLGVILDTVKENDINFV